MVATSQALCRWQHDAQAKKEGRTLLAYIWIGLQNCLKEEINKFGLTCFYFLVVGSKIQYMLVKDGTVCL